MSMDDLSVIEGSADSLLRGAGYETDAIVPMMALAKRALGASNVRVVPARSLPRDAVLAMVDGARQLFLRSGADPIRLRFAAGHELGHWALGVDSSCQANEDLCDAFAACLVAPRRAFQLALRDVGDRYHQLADHFLATESLVALRYGEVTGTPLALVAPLRVRVRGDEFTWPEETKLRVLARALRAPGLRKATLRDDRRRVAMRVA
jgi:hypothetical protein